jgi:hypothetical protein
MAITTLDGVIAGMQPPEEFLKVGAGTQVVGRMYSPFYVTGRPGAAVAPSPGIAGAALTTYAGQIPFTNGASDQYLARFAAQSLTTGTLFLCDRLWHNSGISVTTTGAQTINSVAWPARDHNASTNGGGVRIGLEVSTLTGAGASVVSCSYTDQAGNAGNTATCRPAYAAASVVGTFYDFSLAAGDSGVRSIQTYTSTVSMTSGAIHLVAYRILARVGVTVAGLEYAVDALTSGFPKLHDNTVPFLLMLPAVTTAPTLMSGQVIYSHG